MTAARRPKPLWLGAVFVAIGMAILLTLGTWQLQRLKWKEDLMAHIERLQGAVPVPLAMVADRPAEDLDFTKVRLDCPGLEAAPTIRLYAVEAGRSGSRFITACRLGARSVLVDRGFAPDETAAPPGRPVLTEPVLGVLRVPSGANGFTPPNDVAANRWYWRDIPAMAAALRAPAPMPVMLMLESPAPLNGAYPRPAPLPTEISNRHLEYALTWYGLAAALAGVYIALLLRKRTS
jgi:surfeit locus 1 family protein